MHFRRRSEKADWQEGAGICCALRDSYPRFRRPGPELDTPASLRWPAEDLIDADSLGSGQGSFPFLGKFRGLGSASGEPMRKLLFRGALERHTIQREPGPCRS